MRRKDASEGGKREGKLQGFIDGKKTTFYLCLDGKGKPNRGKKRLACGGGTVLVSWPVPKKKKGGQGDVGKGRKTDREPKVGKGHASKKKETILSMNEERGEEIGPPLRDLVRVGGEGEERHFRKGKRGRFSAFFPRSDIMRKERSLFL